MKYDLLTIDELGDLNRGRSRYRPRDDKSLYGGNYPFIQTGDVKHAPFYISTYSQTYNEKGLSQSKIWKKGTLCVTIAANIADTAFLGFDACFPDSILGFIPFKDKSDSRFVKYCFDVYKTTLEAISKGTTQDNLSLDKIKRVKFKIPPLPIQRKIAAVLSAYDDLIEKNNRRIAILEKMAEELYREWFVRLRFPGHEKVKVVKGVPEGWEVKKIGDIFQTFLGGTPSREVSSFWGGNIPWINSGEINKLRIIKESEFITENGFSKSATKMMPEKTTVLAITGATLGQVSFTEIDVCANQSVVGIFDKTKIYNYYIFRFITQNIENIISKQGGGGQQHINKDIVEKEYIILPNEDIVKLFNEKYSNFEKLIKNLLNRNDQLQNVRDRLLSRLMSGKIDVENLEIQFPESMQEEIANA